MAQIPYSRTVIVPTDDVIVRNQLRGLDEPMCVFGEGPAERRERLAGLLSKLAPEERSKLQSQTTDNKIITTQGSDEIFYYEGSEDLKKARYQIANYSIQQANCRLDLARIKQLEPMSTRLIPQQDLIERIRKIEDLGSYIDEGIPTTELKKMTSCNFDPQAQYLATSMRSGRCKIWTMPDMDTHLSLTGHKVQANFITFNPKSGIDLAPNVANLASCAVDGSIYMWNMIDGNSPVCCLSGEQKWQVIRVRFHPCGQYLSSSCSDKSWRLWDLATETEILHQEGHSDTVFDTAFHTDGSLLASAGLDSFARLWDLRTGRSIQLLEGHSKGLRTIDFSPDGYHLATGSLDDTVKVWNLRKCQLEYTIPAHVKPVTTVMFEKENGYYLTSASLDKTVKFWSCKTWAPIKTLDAFDDSVMKIDLSPDSQYLASCYGKFLKLWATTASAAATGDEEMTIGDDGAIGGFGVH